MGKESACNVGDTGETGFILGSGRSLEDKMAAHSSVAWKTHECRTLAGYRPKGHTESDTTEKSSTNTHIRF